MSRHHGNLWKSPSISPWVHESMTSFFRRKTLQGAFQNSTGTRPLVFPFSRFSLSWCRCPTRSPPPYQGMTQKASWEHEQHLDGRCPSRDHPSCAANHGPKNNHLRTWKQMSYDDLWWFVSEFIPPWFINHDLEISNIFGPHLRFITGLGFPFFKFLRWGEWRQCADPWARNQTTGENLRWVVPTPECPRPHEDDFAPWMPVRLSLTCQSCLKAIPNKDHPHYSCSATPQR